MSKLLSPAQAAQVVGVSRWTVVRAINAQALRASRDNKNQWRIKLEDLQTWCGAHDAHSVLTEHDQPSAPLVAPSDAHTNAGLREEAAALRTEVRLLNEGLVDLRRRLDASEARADAAHTHAQALALALTQRPLGLWELLRKWRTKG